jgi:hypothetical protein
MTVKTLEGVEFIEWCRNRRWNTCGLQVGPAIKNDSRDPEQAAFIGARIGRRNTGQLSTPRIKAAPLSRIS